MATSRTVTFEYLDPPDEVMALLRDPIYLRHRSETAGERNIEVRVEPEGDGVRITVAREKDIPVPAFAKAALGNSRAVESTLWRADGDRWVAEYTIEASGIPVKAKGRSVLSPSGGGCRYVSTVEITARVPLIAGRIEAAAADGLEEQLRLNADRNAQALARGAQRGPQSLIAGLRVGAREEDDDGTRSNEG
jgi:hypothetical protein